MCVAVYMECVMWWMVLVPVILATLAHSVIYVSYCMFVLDRVCVISLIGS